MAGVDRVMGEGWTYTKKAPIFSRTSLPSTADSGPVELAAAARKDW
jgi:hypothetical protein